MITTQLLSRLAQSHCPQWVRHWRQHRAPAGVPVSKHYYHPRHNHLLSQNRRGARTRPLGSVSVWSGQARYDTYTRSNGIEFRLRQPSDESAVFKRRLPAIRTGGGVGPDSFYPVRAQLMVNALPDLSLTYGPECLYLDTPELPLAQGLRPVTIEGSADPFCINYFVAVRQATGKTVTAAVSARRRSVRGMTLAQARRIPHG